MTAIRQDAWTSDEDILLAEIVLTHIRKGSTQLKAFEEAGVKLKRTSAACGFRWNSLVRKQYKKGIELAKQERKNRAAKQYISSIEDGKQDGDSVQSLITKDEVATFFQKLETTLAELRRVELEKKSLQQENVQLKSEIMEKEKDLELFNQLQSEYETLLDILNHARKRSSNKEIVSS